MAKLAVVLTLALAATCSLSAPQTSSKVSLSLQLKVNNGIPANIMVSLRDGTDPIIRSINAMSEARAFTSRTQKINTLVSSLKSHAAETQASVLSALSTFPFVEIKSFWVTNKIYVSGLVTASLVERLAGMYEIAEIREEIVIQLDEPIDYKEVDNVSPFAEWGINSIKAPEAWALNYTGEGAKVATIDTGARGTHQTLAGRLVRAYGWFDPSAAGTPAPNDQQGHGTHTTANIVGTFGVGVAPSAEWMACKGCPGSNCPEAALVACGQWVTCPTWSDGSNPDCSQAPDVCSNSWGGGQGNTFYNDITNAWIVADIIPVFAIGNSGPNCGTANSPGDQNVISVGSTNSANSLSLFSSKGPSVQEVLKPDISAPGENIRSAAHTGDAGYVANSGTSMACPHVAGVVALIKGIDNSLTYTEVKDILYGTATPDLTPTLRNCGGIDTSTFPNNSYGYGKVDAQAAVLAALRYLAAKNQK